MQFKPWRGSPAPPRTFVGASLAGEPGDAILGTGEITAHQAQSQANRTWQFYQ
ncbi:hypothetical protein [Pseudomonas muyukensis]|uniref:Uncharacterized protein n=1 Tax=Pseudomonas muyukensis TaxID=2842357 RepID=A0ABX8MJZ7_9PSED|nr:hypothetical protein [Pseudomonas muyukensis]QXH37501.1 hypothetical protein KSS95_12015 [Pseudomonas muyukensis]